MGLPGDFAGGGSDRRACKGASGELLARTVGVQGVTITTQDSAVQRLPPPTSAASVLHSYNQEKRLSASPLFGRLCQGKLAKSVDCQPSAGFLPTIHFASPSPPPFDPALDSNGRQGVQRHRGQRREVRRGSLRHSRRLRRPWRGRAGGGQRGSSPWYVTQPTPQLASDLRADISRFAGLKARREFELLCACIAI